MKNKKKTSMRMQFALPTVIILSAIVIILGCVSSWLCYKSTLNCGTTAMNESSEVAELAIAKSISAIQRVVKEISTHDVLFSPDSTPEEVNNFLEKKVAEHGLVSGYTFSTDGICVQNGVDYSYHEAYAAAMKGKTFVSSPSHDAITNDLIVIIMAPIWENGIENSRIIGLLAFTAKQELINSTVESLQISENGTSYIIDKHGTTIASPDIQAVSDKVNIGKLAEEDSGLKPIAAIHAKVINGDSGMETCEYNGQSSFISYLPIKGSNGWSICIITPQSDYTEGLKKTVVVTLIIIALSIAISFLFSMKISAKLALPVAHVVGRLESLAKGDVFSPMPEFDTSAEELNRLKIAASSTIDSTGEIIKDISYVLREIANGDFTATSGISEKYIGDYTQIKDALNKIKTDLTTTFSDILQVSEQVSAGSYQVSSGAQSLAQGSTEQASSIQELSAAIAEMSSHIQRNSEDAAKANILTAESSSIMTASVAEMEKTLSAMEEISSTSNNISKVIKVIDDIAFQTNILALNAAVEAARAGSAGKGFAVVADEVRNLSQRSSEAAKNTTVLLEKSIHAVENGTELVNSTSKNFVAVANTASEVTEIVERIANQTQEQSGSILQISSGIEQVSTVVQINSATSEESAAASEELSNQAASLKSMVEKIKIN